jgi:hypothetical protein
VRAERSFIVMGVLCRVGDGLSVATVGLAHQVGDGTPAGRAQRRQERELAAAAASGGSGRKRGSCGARGIPNAGVVVATGLGRQLVGVEIEARTPSAN